MKLKNLKIVTLLITASSILFGTSCLKKNNTTYEDFSTLQDFVILTAGPSGSSSTKVAFNRGADLTNTITVDLASASNSSSPITVTLAVDPAALTAYNAANGTNFVALPTANYKFGSNTLTIPAGQHYAQTTLQLTNLGTLDPAISYMVAVSITDASGKKLSSNLNTLYYFSIGNPLAGNYSWTYRRYNSADTSGALIGGSFTNQIVSVSPTGPTTLLFPESYTQTFVNANGGLLLSFTNSSGTLSNFSVALDAASISAAASGGFTITGAPKIIAANIVGNASTKYAGSTFSFYLQYTNSSGGVRTLVNTFVKQ